MLSMMSGVYVPDSVYTKLPVRSEVEDQRPLRIVGGECLESRMHLDSRIAPEWESQAWK